MPNCRHLPQYETPFHWICPNCEEEVLIIADDNSITDERGTYYPSGWGQPICSNCEQPVPGAELSEADYD